jgi:hypothetical protein
MFDMIPHVSIIVSLLMSASKAEIGWISLQDIHHCV